MNQPSPALLADYASWMASMRVQRTTEVNAAAEKLLKFVDQGRYEAAAKATGVPQIWIATSFEREASSDFRRSPAQGDFWNAKSTHVPKGRGPFNSWTAAAIDAYHLNGLDKVGEANWTWALGCYFTETFNGLGYRDVHHMRTPYLVAGTNLQQPGKYVADGKFDPRAMDQQLGVLPVMMRMAQLAPDLSFPGAWPFSLGAKTVPAGQPTLTPVAKYDVAAVQRALKAAGFDPGGVDGSFGRKTSAALRAFEASKGLVADGLLDQRTYAALVGTPGNT